MISKKEQALALLEEQKFLPLYYHEDPTVSLKVLKGLYSAGVRIVEYTNRGEHALSNFRSLKEHASRNMPGMFLGIGTIKNHDQANSFIEAGADFIVCPSTNHLVGELVISKELLWIPGCMTPTEIADAEIAGAGFVKIFPASILGPGFVSAVRELFPSMKFMPTGTGEATEDSFRSWFNSGVSAIGLGSRLLSKDLVENGSEEKISQAVEVMKKRIHAAASY